MPDMTDTMSALKEIDRTWESLTISNDFVFCKAMLDPDLCREVVEAILGIEVDHVEHIERQEVLDAAPESKSVRLDVYVRDSQGTVYDVEMQAVDTHELAQRTRYYLSLMSLDQIARGQRYLNLKEAYVVFVCGFDPFGRASRVYSFQNRCDELPDLALGDGAKAVFLSTVSPKPEGTPHTKLDEFIDYVASGRVSGGLSARLEAAVARVLDNKEWRLEYMMLEVRDQLNFEKGVTEGRLQGEAIGLRKGLEQGEAAGLRKGLEQGEAEGLRKGLEQGEAAGLRKGLEQGEARFAELAAKLVSLGRAEELARAASDPTLKEALYTELGIA